MEVPVVLQGDVFEFEVNETQLPAGLDTAQNILVEVSTQGLVIARIAKVTLTNFDTSGFEATDLPEGKYKITVSPVKMEKAKPGPLDITRKILWTTDLEKTIIENVAVVVESGLKSFHAT